MSVYSRVCIMILMFVFLQSAIDSTPIIKTVSAKGLNISDSSNSVNPVSFKVAFSHGSTGHRTYSSSDDANTPIEVQAEPNTIKTQAEQNIDESNLENFFILVFVVIVIAFIASILSEKSSGSSSCIDDDNDDGDNDGPTGIH